MSMILKIGVALVAVAVVGGAVWYVMAPTPAPAPEEPQANTPRIESETWIWQQTELNNGEILQPTETGAFTLIFADGRISGTTDCNSFSGSYEIGVDNTLMFGPFAATKMYCEGAQETEFMRMVADSTSYLIIPSGDLVLQMKFDSGSVVFVRK